MVNGDPHEFVDHVYSGQDTVYLYHGIKYWCQGYTFRGTKVHHLEVFQYQPPSNDFLWEYESESVAECMEAFLEAPIFDGKTFWEAEPEIEWVDS